MTPDDVRSDLADSLEHLGVDHIDLYWLHADNPEAQLIAASPKYGQG